MTNILLDLKPRMWLLNGDKIYYLADNVGIGVTNPTDTLEVNGTFSATSKSFLIPHPTKNNKQLRHGSLEGPEHGVYFRGKLQNSNCIELPDYWLGLVNETTITVNLTSIGKYQKLYIEDIKDNCVFVKNSSFLSNKICCFYTIFAERKDVEKMKVEI